MLAINYQCKSSWHTTSYHHTAVKQLCGVLLDVLIAVFRRPRMSKAAELAALIGSQTALSNRNLYQRCDAGGTAGNTS